MHIKLIYFHINHKYYLIGCRTLEVTDRYAYAKRLFLDDNQRELEY
jgi:hypothetical protein